MQPIRLALHANNYCSRTPTPNKQEELAKAHHQLYTQLWALLPGFCTLPTDADVAFKPLARTLGTAIETQPLLRPTVCEALRVLITKLHALTEEGASMPVRVCVFACACQGTVFILAGPGRLRFGICAVGITCNLVLFASCSSIGNRICRAHTLCGGTSYVCICRLARPL